MQEEKFSPEESLQLIQSMIQKTRKSMSDSSVYFLVWGWITFCACVAQFILLNIIKYERHYLVWLVIIPVTVFSFYQGSEDARKTRVKTYLDESMDYLWMGMYIVFFVSIIIFSKLGWEMSVPFFMMLYGPGTFVSGNLLRFRSFIIGGIIAWVLALGALWVRYDYRILFAAAAILFSYIIPAYQLRKKYKTVST